MGKVVYFPDAKEILDLHHETQFPTLECRRALVESDGDADKARQFLKEWGEQRKIHSMIELYR